MDYLISLATSRAVDRVSAMAEWNYTTSLHPMTHHGGDFSKLALKKAKVKVAWTIWTATISNTNNRTSFYCTSRLIC